MSEASMLGLVWAVGVALGVVFFGGLWWTVRRALKSPRPALWFLASLLARMAVVLAGMYFVAGGDWRRLAACLLGIVSARVVVTSVVRRGAPSADRSGELAGHAP